MLPLQLDAQHHDDVDVREWLVPYRSSIQRPGAICPISRGSSDAGPQSTICAPNFDKQKNVRPRHAAVRDIADDGDAQPFECCAAVENGQRIQQRLGRMFMRAIAGIDDGHRQIARQKVRCAGSRMPHDDGIRPHGAERVQRIDQRFAFGDAGTRGGDGKTSAPSRFAAISKLVRVRVEASKNRLTMVLPCRIRSA